MEISVIVPTYNRNKQVLNLLKSLELQSFQNFEVIVVNDGSTDDTLILLEEYKKDTSLTLKIIDSENRGRSDSRNLGVKHAKGEILIFFDDDVVLTENIIENHFRFHQKKGKAILAGPYRYYVENFTDDFHFYRKYMEDRWARDSNGIIRIHNLRINGGNFSIKKENFDIIDGFDSRLKDKEDFKLAYDFSVKHDGEIYFDNNLFVFHEDYKTLKQYIERSVASRLEEIKLKTLDPSIKLKFPERFITIPSNVFKLIFFRIIKKTPLLNFMNNGFVKLLIPKPIRYKIYELLITSYINYIEI